jgi:hypothetical protein
MTLVIFRFHLVIISGDLSKMKIARRRAMVPVIWTASGKNKQGLITG